MINLKDLFNAIPLSTKIKYCLAVFVIPILLILIILFTIYTLVMNSFIGGWIIEKAVVRSLKIGIRDIKNGRVTKITTGAELEKFFKELK